MAERIKAGIIGTGFIGPAHVEAGRRLGNIEFIALARAVSKPTYHFFSDIPEKKF